VKKIAIFASGAGSNAQKIIEFSLQSNNKPIHFSVALIVCNKQQAGVLEIAKQFNIETLILDKETFFSGNIYKEWLQKKGIDFIVLAGFLWKIPDNLIQQYQNKIINIHPALLPKFGGKGMYGTKVHQAVIAANEKESGITIHLVDEEYDHGKTIFQATCTVDEDDTADSLANKIHALEHKHFPEVINSFARSLNKL
jgi:phosphoribosylglycinamide formyltransferase-1